MSDLTIVGASARAAAGSARRAGLVPWAADLFADADLRAMVAGAVRCPAGQYPRALLDILRDGPPGPWMYTGGLENHPNLVRRMAEVRPLWGNGPNALVACRSPFHVEHILREKGLAAPEVRCAGAELPDYCSWLRKPLAGSAGRGIAFAGSPDPAAGGRPTHYFQRFVPGPSMSAVFVRARGEVRLLGVTEQLIGEEWLNAPPFRYAGNVGPVEPAAGLRHDLIRVGDVLGERCGLLGLFGADFVLHDGRPWVVEVNPRYPASVEVLELATGVLALSLHRTAFDPDAAAPPRRPAGPPVVGKAVLYAPRDFEMPPYDPSHYYSHMLGDEVRAARHLAGVHFADIPGPGEVIERGWPVLTVLAEGDDRERCLAALRERAGRVQRLLFGDRPQGAPARDWYTRLDDPGAD
jgi:predicted ATP-grasp superfamily ATP-dependent carboligase